MIWRRIILAMVMLLVCVNDVSAGAAVAMQNKKGAGKAAPQQLPPGYVMTPQGIQKVPDIQTPKTKKDLSPEEVKDIVDLDQLTDAFAISSEPWGLIIDQEDKEIIVEEFIKKYADQDIVIKKPAGLYVGMIDQMSQGSPEMLAIPFEKVLQIVAVMEYDFGNGQNPDLLAQKMLGQQFYETNKKRLMAQQP